MSRVYFHSPSGEAVLRGSERAWCDSVVRDIALGILGDRGPFGDQVDKIRQLIKRDHWIVREGGPGEARFWDDFKLSMNGFSGDLLEWKGQPLSSFSFRLNTALLLGNDTVKLMAYLHGQCEIHGWIAGEDRDWYADLVKTGLRSGLLRKDMGWNDVLDLLTSRDDEPVVTSYSVTDSFPNPEIAGLVPEPGPESDGHDELWTRWEELSDEDRWEQAFAGIMAREKPNSSWRWSPDVFATQKFGHELTFLDLLAPDVLDRVERALA